MLYEDVRRTVQELYSRQDRALLAFLYAGRLYEDVAPVSVLVLSGRAGLLARLLLGSSSVHPQDDVLWFWIDEMSKLVFSECLAGSGEKSLQVVPIGNVSVQSFLSKFSVRRAYG